MKKTWVCIILSVLAVLLCSCRAEVQWETVDDEAVLTSAPVEEPYVITFGVPEDAELEPLTSGSRSLYTQKDGDYEIFSDVIVAPDLDEALRAVSGFGENELDVLRMERFGLPEYRFAWASVSDEGNYVSQASLVEDGGYYYALIFSVREEAGTAYADCAEAVFSSFGLYGNEML